jgi:U3 small nucleolar RNA-associated protein 25
MAPVRRQRADLCFFLELCIRPSSFFFNLQDILFYQLPQHPQFYSELVNFFEESAAGGAMATVSVLFGRSDALRLERVVGSARAAKMLKSGGSGTFLFC